MGMIKGWQKGQFTLSGVVQYSKEGLMIPLGGDTAGGDVSQPTTSMWLSWYSSCN